LYPLNFPVCLSPCSPDRSQFSAHVPTPKVAFACIHSWFLTSGVSSLRFVVPTPSGRVHIHWVGCKS
jgi:hypothetical protein